MTETERVDGRTARARRTRAAIVDAHLSLLLAGDLRPTGERIAEAAGVSLRTLWTSFKDLETLFAASGERIFEMMRADRRPIPADLPLPERITRYCAQRAHELEILAPAARAAILREPFSAQLRANRTIELTRLRTEISQVFAPEIAAAPDPVRLTDALLANFTFAVWNVLRDQLGMEVDRAAAVVRHSIDALLGAA
jgi:TetR/AcrR family transcriptional regulator, regulator of autoinduction and epiphytic fitness